MIYVGGFRGYYRYYSSYIIINVDKTDRVDSRVLGRTIILIQKQKLFTVTTETDLSLYEALSLRR